MSVTDALRQDIKGAMRGLWTSPGFAVAALVTLSLGIGATSAIFSVVKAVLLTPLPYDSPEQRVMVWSKWVSFDKTWVSSQEVFDYRELASTMTDVAFWANTFQNLTDAGEPVRLNVGLVSANTFDVLGARPLLGRMFNADEERSNGAPVAVLGYGLWESQFGADRALIGRRIMLNDVPVEVIGVMPEGFRLPTDFTADAAEPTQLWRPLRVGPGNLNRNNHGFYAAAVLAAGQTPATATAELEAIIWRLTEQGAYPPQMQFTAFAVGLDEEIRGELRVLMRLLMGAVGFLLLIACVNVANLLLVRGDARVREMAVRTALGASPNRLARQLLTESIVLAIVGALLAIGLASVALRVLTSVDPTSLPPLATLRLDLTVIAFTLVLAVVTTLLFGLAPALRTLRVEIVDSLREGGQNATASNRRQRLRGVLVAVEVALAVVLVIGAGLMIRTLAALGDIDLGFNPDRVLTMRVTIAAAKYGTHESVVNFFDELRDRVAALPGVEAAGVVRALPLATTVGDFDINVEGFEESPGRDAKGDLQVVSDGAFEAMGARLVRGRWFTPADTMASVPVAVVNETMARAYWTDPAAVIGGRIRVGNVSTRPWATVVGIVGDERHNGVTAIVNEKFYIPHNQWPSRHCRRRPDSQRVRGRAHDRRSAERGGRGPQRDPADGCEPAGRQRAVDERRGRGRTRDAAPDRVCAGRICRDRTGACRGRHLRCPRVSRVAADTGDWHQAGHRRRSVAGARHGAAARTLAGGHRYRRRADWRLRADAADAEPALRGPSERSIYVCRSSGRSAGHRAGGKLSAGPAGDQGVADDRAGRGRAFVGEARDLRRSCAI